MKTKRRKRIVVSLLVVTMLMASTVSVYAANYSGTFIYQNAKSYMGNDSKNAGSAHAFARTTFADPVYCPIYCYIENLSGIPVASTVSLPYNTPITLVYFSQYVNSGFKARLVGYTTYTDPSCYISGIWHASY